MTDLQVWVLFALPALLLGLSLFVGRSPVRTALGYVVLAAGFGAVAAFDQIAGAIFGSVLVLLFAAGRATGTGLGERSNPEAQVPGLVGTDRTLDPPRRGAPPPA